MIKPQEKYDDVYGKFDYPDKVKDYYNMLIEKLPNHQCEYVDFLAEGVYKAAYLDGFKDALFFADLL